MKVRIHNDIPCVWRFYTGQGESRQPYNLEGRSLILTITDAFGRSFEHDFEVEGNALSFTFYGTEQSALGDYTFTFEQNRGEVGWMTIDAVSAVELVARQSSTIAEGGLCEGISSEIECSVLSLESEVSTGTYEQLPDKPKINGVTLVGDKTSEELGIPRPNAYTSLRKVADFLYEADYDTLDYTNAYEHFRHAAPTALGGCSVIGAGNLVGRNYDWLYNHDATFIVRTAEAQGRRSVVGIAGSVPGLTIDEVDSRAYNEAYKVMPFYLQDGVNDAGLFAEINVVPSLHNAPTIPQVEKRDSVSVVMLVRYILDRFDSVDTAVAYLRDYVEIYTPTTLAMMGYEAHFFLKDATKSVELEIVDGEIVTIETDKATNFHLYGVEFNTDGSVYTNADVADGHLPTAQFVDTYGSGLERWNILNDATITDIASLQAVMRSVNFSKAYTELTDIWYSEFVGGSITVDAPIDAPEFAARLAEYRQKWADRSRDTAEVWNTAHSAVYDLTAKTLLVSVQEEDTWHPAYLGGLTQRIKALEDMVQALISSL